MKTVSIAVIATGIFASGSFAAGPILSLAEIQSAIDHGSRFKTRDLYLEEEASRRGLKIGLASGMAKDGIAKSVTFFGDWDFIAAAAAAANQQMRALKAEDIKPAGLLHAFVQVHARGAYGMSRNWTGAISANARTLCCKLQRA